MPKEEKSNEAPVHFELYRLLKDNIDQCHSARLHYESVEPECPAQSGAVDLVITAKRDDKLLNFLAIEVKRPTIGAYLLFDHESEKQIEGYAKHLESDYLALTDGEILRLSKANTPFVNHRFHLDNDNVRRLLTELSELDDGKRQKLSLPEVPAKSRESATRELRELARALNNVFNQLQQRGFKLEEKEWETKHMRYLTVDSVKRVFRLAIDREGREISKNQSYIHIQLVDLREKLGVATLHEMLENLTHIPFFNKWVDPNDADRRKRFTWKLLQDVTIEGNQQLDMMKKQLLQWFSELSKQLEKKQTNARA